MRLAHGMELTRHGTIIAHDKILIGFEGDGWALPVAGILNVRFVKRLAIDDDLPVVEGDGFAGEAYDALHICVAGKMDAGVGKTDEDHIAASRRMKEKG